MSYQALYRKFRPQEFSDVKGQDPIVTTLKNQLKSDRIGHAYLFCGTRGTGKTTVAKLFAKAVNCEHPVEQSPCGQCRSCQTIASGTSMNVIEIDAASNNGVENIRQIRDEVAYRPTEGKYKVYIIDEVHMLSIGAFNALLKTLEEPPSYVIFILATTEAHKIPITILSRCQRYDFRRIAISTITDRLKELMVLEHYEADEKAVRYVAKMADGSMRDALSLLDQCVAFYPDRKLSYDMALEVLGAVDTEVFSQLMNAILDRNAMGCIRVLEEIVVQGRELRQFVNDFTWHMRNLLILQSSDGMEDALEMSSERLVEMKTEARKIDTERLIRYIRIFSDLSNELRYATQKRILIEIALIRVCRPQMENDVTSLADRLDDLEQKIKNRPVSITGNMPKEEKEKPVLLPTAIPSDIKSAAQNLKSVIAECPMPARQYLSKAVPTLGENQELILLLDDRNGYEYLYENRAECMDFFCGILQEKTGKNIPVRVKLNETDKRAKDAVPDLTELIHFDIDIDTDTEE